MKKTILAIATILVAQFAQASYLEHCELTGKIESLGAFKSPNQSEGKYQKVLTLNIEFVEDKGSHGGCDHHLSTSKELEVRSSNAADLASLILGQKITVDYFYANSLTPDGVVESTSSTLVSQAEKVIQAVMSNKGVGEYMLRLKRKLSFGPEPVVILAAHTQYLPEGLCGFAGCEAAYSVTITLGQQFRNSQRETIFVKAYTSALGDVQVELIK